MVMGIRLVAESKRVVMLVIVDERVWCVDDRLVVHSSGVFTWTDYIYDCLFRVRQNSLCLNDVIIWMSVLALQSTNGNAYAPEYLRRTRGGGITRHRAVFGSRSIQTGYLRAQCRRTAGEADYAVRQPAAQALPSSDTPIAATSTATTSIAATSTAALSPAAPCPARPSQQCPPTY